LQSSKEKRRKRIFSKSPCLCGIADLGVNVLGAGDLLSGLTRVSGGMVKENFSGVLVRLWWDRKMAEDLGGSIGLGDMMSTGSGNNCPVDFNYERIIRRI